MADAVFDEWWMVVAFWVNVACFVLGIFAARAGAFRDMMVAIVWFGVTGFNTLSFITQWIRERRKKH